jgi:hypothetical protein
MNVKLDLFYAGLRDFGLILVLNPGLFQRAASVRAAARKFCLQGLVDDFRNGAAAAAAILGPRFPPGFGGMGFRQAPRKWRGLALPGTLGLFQGAQQLLHPALQSLVGGLQLHHFSPKSSILLYQRLHALKLPSRRIGTSTFLEEASKR